MEKENRFKCCFENDYKGIFFEVEKEKDCSFANVTMYNDFEVETQVCLRKNDIERLAQVLQNILKEWDN